jgi:hypothetical protein
MDDKAAFDAFMAQLETALDTAPPWRLTEAEQTLAAFARAMNDASTDGMSNVVRSAPEDACRYAEAFETIGAREIATEIRLVAAQDEYSGHARRRLALLNRRVESEWRSLWNLALAYAKRHAAFPREDRE